MIPDTPKMQSPCHELFGNGSRAGPFGPCPKVDLGFVSIVDVPVGVLCCGLGVKANP